MQVLNQDSGLGGRDHIVGYVMRENGWVQLRPADRLKVLRRAILQIENRSLNAPPIVQAHRARCQKVEGTCGCQSPCRLQDRPSTAELRLATLR